MSEKHIFTDPDTKKPIEVEFNGIGSDGIHVVDAKFPIDDKEISFQFTEKFKAKWIQNYIAEISRDYYNKENAKNFKEAFSKAYQEFQKENPIYYIYRHYGPMNKIGYINSCLIGYTTKYNKINQMMKDDYEKFTKDQLQELRFTYSISIGDFFVTENKNINNN